MQFRRSATPETAATVVLDDDLPEARRAKGRPTPSRKEAEAARKKTLKVPTDPKEAKRAARDRARVERVQSRQALASGDDRALPARDQGPVKAYVRNFVDGRRSAGEFFIPVAVGVLVLGFVRVAYLEQVLLFAWVVMLVGVVGDTAYIWYRLRKDLPEKFPAESHKGAVPYAVMRSIQLRRLRLPKAKVKAGGKPVVPKAQRAPKA
ncbi:MAG: hypothetical protein JWR85_3404 [Marmoricola sp.]|nr:hypothetical protein [Marmoricola sp.]